jgi:predicted nucleic acid-binding Zn finger protein
MHAPSAWAATPGTVERTPRAPGLGAAFVPLSATAVADAIFDEIRLSGTETRPPELTDRHLEVLASIFDEKHLGNALELVQSGKVKRLVAHRSRRSCFQVRGRTVNETYLCYPDAFCSCRAFQWDVISRGEKVACKHQLAVKVADRRERRVRLGSDGSAHGAAVRGVRARGRREKAKQVILVDSLEVVADERRATTRD